jgi:hypothetical protein
MLPLALPPVVQGTGVETEAELPSRAAAAPSLAAIAPTASEPSVDIHTAQLRARVRHSHPPTVCSATDRGAMLLITYRKCTRLNAFESNQALNRKRHVQTRSQ